MWFSRSYPNCQEWQRSKPVGSSRAIIYPHKVEKAQDQGQEVMTEVRVVNAKTGAEKGSKAQRYDLIPWEAVGQIAEIYEFGSRKYADHNWRKGYDWSLSYAALQRHLAAFWEGENNDPESGLPHMAHAGWHCLALLTFMREHPELDNRFTTLKNGLSSANTNKD